jgi:hypothetical protein
MVVDKPPYSSPVGDPVRKTVQGFLRLRGPQDQIENQGLARDPTPQVRRPTADWPLLPDGRQVPWAMRPSPHEPDNDPIKRQVQHNRQAGTDLQVTPGHCSRATGSDPFGAPPGARRPSGTTPNCSRAGHRYYVTDHIQQSSETPRARYRSRAAAHPGPASTAHSQPRWAGLLAGHRSRAAEPISPPAHGRQLRRVGGFWPTDGHCSRAAHLATHTTHSRPRRAVGHDPRKGVPVGTDTPPGGEACRGPKDSILPGAGRSGTADDLVLPLDGGG